jgi:uncharacterized protein YdaU (DUF1376 family)
MSKDPAFLFYPNDYLGGTMGMSCEQKGAYIDLLIFQFNNHNFTEAQAKQVLSICFASVWEVLKNKFKTEGENNEFFYNERLRLEIDKRKAFSESRRINALHPKTFKKTKKNTKKAYAKHMGNENENENKDINNKCTIEEIRNYCTERNNKVDPETFFNFYESKGWMIGKNKMKDWKAAVRTWEKNDFNKSVPAATVIKDDFTWCKKCGARRLKSDVDENGICSGRCENATAAL